MSALTIFLIFWAVCVVAIVIVLIRGPKHGMKDPADVDEDFVPESWMWPAREQDDVSTVRHGGLGR